jgi:LysR family transcriptional activator of nhaA
MNLKHLYYFWKVARHGGVVRAGEAIHVTPQTLSGQIRLLEESLGTPLFSREGRTLALTEAGRLALDYAEEIFALDAELERTIRDFPKGRPTEFRVGVSDALPKALAYRLLRPAMDIGGPVRLVCREWRLDQLLAELALHRLDLVISDSPVPSGVDVRAYGHRLGGSGVAFLARRDLAARTQKPFPACLAELPLLLPGEDSAMHRRLAEWLDRKRLRPAVVGEFDDHALLAAFGQEGAGVFPVASALAADCLADDRLILLGHADRVRIDYFAISVQRRLTHPCVLAITATADASLRDGGETDGD